MQNILLVGCGDIATRLAPLLITRYRVFALLRDASQRDHWRTLGATPLVADLDRPATLRRLSGLAHAVIHLAPPPSAGKTDSRTRHLLATLAAGESLPRSLIYVSTTGVYGDCGGQPIDETRPLRPHSARAGRRVDAERQLRAFGRQTGCRVVILRAPGIYAADRLPLERLEKHIPALCPADDVYTNHIHADDLAMACRAALRYGRANRAVNAVDDTEMTMGSYFDAVADAFHLPRPPRISRGDAEKALSPLQLSFMSESRRIGNRRLKTELKLHLAYPTVAHGLAAALPREHHADR